MMYCNNPHRFVIHKQNSSRRYGLETRKPLPRGVMPVTRVLILCTLIISSHAFLFRHTVRAQEPRPVAHALAFVEEGERETDRGNYARAIRLFTAAIKGGVNAYQWRGRAYFLSGDKKKALEDINYYISLQPSEPQAYLLRGDITLSQDNAAAALQDYRMAVKLTPSSVVALVSRGLARMALEQYGSAVRDFERALQLDPRNLDALTNLGVANTLAHRPRAARAALTSALELETNTRWKTRIAEWLARLPHEEASGADRDLPPEDEVGEEESSEADTGAPTASLMRPEPHGYMPSSVPHSRGPSILMTRPPAGTGKWKGTHLSGKWETTYKGVHISLEIQHSGASISGVLRTHGPFGQNNTYHFTGTAGYDGTIKASHKSGHSFQGRVTEDGRVVGTVTTRFGTTIPIDFAPK